MTAPDDYDPSAFPPFAVTADTVVFTRREGRLMVVLIQRAKGPYQGRWALPGGFVGIEEDLEPAAIRELAEETGLEVSAVRQLGAYGAPDRDPRMRVVTVVYWTTEEDVGTLAGASDAADARLWPVDDVLGDPEFLAFDHRQILTDAVRIAGL
jgi:8-oxo-dGTP diphosphatase